MDSLQHGGRGEFLVLWCRAFAAGLLFGTGINSQRLAGHSPHQAPRQIAQNFGKFDGTKNNLRPMSLSCIVSRLCRCESASVEPAVVPVLIRIRCGS